MQKKQRKDYQKEEIKYQKKRFDMAYNKVTYGFSDEGTNFKQKAINSIKRDNTEVDHFKDSMVEHTFWSS